MIESPFTIRNISKFVKKQNSNLFITPEKSTQDIATKVLNQINSKTIFENSLNYFQIKQKPVLRYSNKAAQITSSLIIRNLALNTRITQPNRNDIISSLISSLQDGTPYSIHRYDIKSFYESIDRDALIQILENESLCSKKTLNLIKLLFGELEKTGISGLPRGLNISAYLSEIYMKAFDKKIKRFEKINFYARFVDDIIILSSHDKEEEVTSLIEKELNDGLLIHEGGKRSHLKIRKSEIPVRHTKETGQSENFNYLGYEFKIYNTYLNTEDFRQKRRVEIDISENKLKK